MRHGPKSQALPARLVPAAALIAVAVAILAAAAPLVNAPAALAPAMLPPVFHRAPQPAPQLFAPAPPTRQITGLATPMTTVGGTWQAQGPRPITDGQVEHAAPANEVIGAIKAVAAHPSNPNVVYVGTVNGGIWKTTNAAASSPSWTALTDQQASLSIGALKFDPTDKTANTLIAGVGRFSSDERFGGPRIGLLRTIDGGRTWTTLSLVGANIAGVAARGSVLIAAVDTADVNSLSNEGIFRSVDGGAHFVQVSGNGASGLPLGVAYDLAEDRAHPSTLYTGVVFAGFVGASDGIYKSTDLGATWTLVSDAAINGLFHDTGANATRNVKIAVGNADNVFAGIQNDTPSGWQLAGLFRSGDGGAHWTELDLPQTNEHGTMFGINPGGQGELHFSLAADPADANVVYAGGDRQPAANEGGASVPAFPNSIGAQNYSGRLFRIDASRPAGSQFAHLTNSNKLGPAGGGTAGNSSPHADSRAMVFDAGGNLLEVDDGGIFRRTHPASDTGDWFALSGNLQVTEFHDIAYDGNSNIVLGGTQDVGVPQQQTSGGGTWVDIAQGDGGCVAARMSATAGISLRYSSSQDLSGFTLDTYNAANVRQSESLPPLTVSAGAPLQTQFFTPIETNAISPTRLLIGGRNSVYESTDQGATIREIGPGIVVNDAVQRKAVVYGGRSGGINNPDLIYAGQKDQVFIRTAPAPAAFTQLTAYPGRGSGREVNGIAIDPQNYRAVFVVDPSNVYASSDMGATWTNITGNLAAGGKFTPADFDSIHVLRRPGAAAVVLGTGHQVFISFLNSLGSWQQLGGGLPNAHVERMAYDESSDVVVAGTLGRGSWSLQHPLSGPTPAPTPTPTATPKPTPTAIPLPPVISAIPKIILVGGSLVINGSNFTNGSMVNFFVATAGGAVNAGPFTPSHQTPAQLTLNIPATVSLGQGFVSVQVVNTDTGFLASNIATALLQGSAAAGIPSLTAIDGMGLAPTSSDPHFASNNVETVVVQGTVVKLGGSGFDATNGVAVNLFCPCAGGKVGPFLINPGAALSPSLATFSLPSSGPNAPPTGPGSFVIINKGGDGSYARSSNAVSVPIGQAISVSSVSQSGTVITVAGTGFSSATAINFFNVQSGGVINLGGFGADGTPRIALILVNSDRFKFTRPLGAAAGAAYVQAINPPFVPFTSSGNDPGGAFTLK